MKLVFVLFDSLVKNALGCYGSLNIETPNFNRFCERSITFDNHYVGSLPCMPARRDLHTGRLNFLHRSWGPFEPFDHSFSEILRSNGTYTHLVTDHYHYFEDGGSTYHNRYSSWDFVRGQEWDKWRAMIDPPIERFKKLYHSEQLPLGGDNVLSDGRLQCMINREYMKKEKDYCCPRVFDSGMGFLKNNAESDNWILHLECFDPHEPFSAPPRFKERYKTGYIGPVFDWPRYKRSEETEMLAQEMRANYAALVSMCDEYFGKLLDFFDTSKLWSNTALILTTDHGFMLEEHEWWGKNRMPFYNEISNIPLIFYHPKKNQKGGTRIKSLTQATDLMPTILDIFGVSPPNHVEGKSLMQLTDHDRKIREGAMFGMFGAGTNVTDGRFTYFKYPEDMTKTDLFDYTLMPMRQKSLYDLDVLKDARLINDFKFTRGVPLLKIPARRNKKGQPVGHFGQGGGYDDTNTVLFDLEKDPNQNYPFRDKASESRLSSLLADLMKKNEAPPEAFVRLGMEIPEDKS